MGNCYIPPAYKPRLFPRLVRWTLLAMGCVAFVCFCIAAMWFAAALYK